MTNEQLVCRIKAGEDVAENMKLLYEQVKAFIHMMAIKYQSSGMVEDLEQEGYLALYPAIDGYDPTRGVTFLTYAENWIRQRMQRYLQMNGSDIRLSFGRDAKVNKYKRSKMRFIQNHGRYPTDLEMARILGISQKDVQKLREYETMPKHISLDSPVEGKDGQFSTVGDQIASGENFEDDIIDQIEYKQLQDTLWPLVDALPGEQGPVIRARYQNNMSLPEIVEYTGIEKQEVQKLQAKALNGLRKPNSRGKLRRFLPEAMECMAYQGGLDAFNRTWTSSTERAALKLYTD